MRDILLILIVAVCTVRAFFRPVFGMQVFLCFSLLNPQSLTWGPAQALPFSQIVALATIGGFVLFHEPKRWPMRSELLCIVVLWLVFAISSMGADYPDRALARLIANSKFLLMVVLSAALITSKEQLLVALRIIAWSLGFHGAKAGLFVLATGGNYMVFGPDHSFLAANNSIGLALAMNVPLLAMLSRLETHRWLRRLMLAMMLLSYPAVIGTYSRGAWLGLGVATAFLVFRSRHRIVMGLLCTVAVVALLPYAPDRAVRRYDQLVNYEEESSAQSRFWNWRFATKVYLANPVFGAGFDYYGIEAYARYYPEFLEAWPGAQWSCHSVWFSMLSEHGTVGVTVFVGMLVLSMLSLSRLIAYSRGDPARGWITASSCAIQGALVAFLVSGSFLDVAYFDLLWQLVALIAILREVVARGEMSQAERVVAPHVGSAPDALRPVTGRA